MKKYEYKTIEYVAKNKLFTLSIDIDSKEIEGVLNKEGEEGWELVSTVNYALNGFTRKVILF